VAQARKAGPSYLVVDLEVTMRAVRHLTTLGGLLLVHAFLAVSSVEAGSIRQTWRDSFLFTTVNLVGTETDFLFTVDTEIIVSEDTFRNGQKAQFDYTQTYLMTTDPTVLGLTRGNPEMVPANLFPTETAPGDLERLYPRHFEHDLFIEGCVQFSGLTSATLKTNSPAPGGINSITIGPIGVGGGASMAGDTTYNVHQTAEKTFLDWVTTEDRGGFFFNGASINFKGDVEAIADTGSASLFTRNSMWLSANNSVFPLYLLRDGQDVLYEKGSVEHGVTLNCVPEPGTLTLAAIGALSLMGNGRRRKRLRDPAVPS
jgi:hypothetical protein